MIGQAAGLTQTQAVQLSIATAGIAQYQLTVDHLQLCANNSRPRQCSDTVEAAKPLVGSLYLH
jgi:hypothetical protein